MSVFILNGRFCLFHLDFHRLHYSEFGEWASYIGLSYTTYTYYNTKMDHFLKSFFFNHWFLHINTVQLINFHNLLIFFWNISVVDFKQPELIWLTKKILPTFRLVRITIHFWLFVLTGCTRFFFWIFMFVCSFLLLIYIAFR